MSERLALLKAILAAPDDDLPRLVFADWLEENGTSDADDARAEFIRLGCLSKAKLKITSAETKWVDKNWPRLLPAVVTARPDGANPPGISRDGRLLRLYFRWTQACRVWIADLVFEFVRGFARRVEYTNGHGYRRFWQAVATDEPLAYHRPQVRPGCELPPPSRPDELTFPVCRLMPTTWGSQVFARILGCEEEDVSGERKYKLFRMGQADLSQYHAFAVADERDISLPHHRARAAVATAMTARAREFAGLS